MTTLITGASGKLGAYLLRELGKSRRPAVAWGGPGTSVDGDRQRLLFGFRLQSVDLTDRDVVAKSFRAIGPDVVVHAAAMSNADQCFRNPEMARRLNTNSTQLLVELAAETGCSLVYVSTDCVFSGEKGNYSEQDLPDPKSIYGQTKLAAEEAVLAYPRGAVIRVSLLFGPALAGRRGFFDSQLEALNAGKTCNLFEDEWRSPLGFATAASAVLALADSDHHGLLHLGGPQRMSRLDMGLRLARFLGCDESTCVRTLRSHTPTAEPRPRDVSLDSSRWRAAFPDQPWPAYEEALGEMLGG